MDARKTFAVGIALIFGGRPDMAPGLYAGVPPGPAPVQSSLTLTTVLAVVLTQLLRGGPAPARRR
jgi:xanthine/uracil permease